MTALLLETREQAIHWLKGCGLIARKHSGWLGDAIAVSRPVPSDPRGGCPHHTLILFPAATGWTVGRSLPGRRGLGHVFASLDEAARYAANTLRATRE